MLKWTILPASRTFFSLLHSVFDSIPLTLPLAMQLVCEPLSYGVLVEPKRVLSRAPGALLWTRKVWLYSVAKSSKLKAFCPIHAKVGKSKGLGLKSWSQTWVELSLRQTASRTHTSPDFWSVGGGVGPHRPVSAPAAGYQRTGQNVPIAHNLHIYSKRARDCSSRNSAPTGPSINWRRQKLDSTETKMVHKFHLVPKSEG